MHIDILGISGTFMGSIALIAREAGHTVTGADHGVYPPMSTLLQEQGIPLREGYDEPCPPSTELHVIGNALSRGNPAVETILDQGAAYTSGPQWLAENILRERWVLAISGTHGKTTTASMLAWILTYAGHDPGFLIGGVPGNFDRSARLGTGRCFVIEADEYDSAFFDKRSKFVHFRPRTLVINNIEYDHADIFDDLAAIQRQFHHLIRTVPGNGRLLANADETSVDDTLAQGYWSELTRFGTRHHADWRLSPRGSGWRVSNGIDEASLAAPLPGEHNARNAVAAILAARHAGVPWQTSLEALESFRGVRRRLEVQGRVNGIDVIDDFAHHPTAIAATLTALAGEASYERLIAVIEPRSNSMRQGAHRQQLAGSLAGADAVFCLDPPELTWPLADALAPLGGRAECQPSVAELVDAVVRQARPGDAIVVMSNGGFDGIHQRLLDALAQ
jgi:UDP-N-acetylmuramate: L-alanyl-gamma-D-glutamyl-meso-diaminopimelate ligase